MPINGTSLYSMSNNHHAIAAAAAAAGFFSVLAPLFQLSNPLVILLERKALIILSLAAFVVLEILTFRRRRCALVALYPKDNEFPTLLHYS